MTNSNDDNTRSRYAKSVANAMLQHAGNDEAAIRMTAALRGTKAAAELAQDKALPVLQRPLPRLSNHSSKSLEGLIGMAASDAEPVRAAWSRFVARFRGRVLEPSPSSTPLAQALAMYSIGALKYELDEATAKEYLNCMRVSRARSCETPSETQARLQEVFAKLTSASATARLMAKEFPTNASAVRLSQDLSEAAARSAMSHVLQGRLYERDMVRWFRDNEEDTCDAFQVHMTMYRRGTGHFAINAKHANTPTAMPHHAAIKALVPYARNGDSLSVAAQSFARVQPLLNELRRLEARMHQGPAGQEAETRAEMDQIKEEIDAASRDYLAHARLVDSGDVDAAALQLKRQRQAAASTGKSQKRTAAVAFGIANHNRSPAAKRARAN